MVIYNEENSDNEKMNMVQLGLSRILVVTAINKARLIFATVHGGSMCFYSRTHFRKGSLLVPTPGSQAKTKFLYP